VTFRFCLLLLELHVCASAFLLAESVPDFPAPPLKGGVCAPSRGRRGLVPVVRRRGTAWRSGIPTRPPFLKISGGSPARSFTPTGAVGGSLQGVGPRVPARGAKRPGNYSAPTYPTLGPNRARIPRPTLHLPYTWPHPRRTAPVSRGLPYTYPTPTLYPAVRDEPRPCPTTYPTPTLHLGRTAPVSPAYPILRPTQTSPACPPLPTLRRFPARGQVPAASPGPTLQNRAAGGSRGEPTPPRPSPARAPGAYPTKPAGQSIRDALPRHSLPPSSAPTRRSG
jgi:hypothetical protein